jgi:hypothetical protein
MCTPPTHSSPGAMSGVQQHFEVYHVLQRDSWSRSLAQKPTSAVTCTFAPPFGKFPRNPFLEITFTFLGYTTQCVLRHVLITLAAPIHEALRRSMFSDAPRTGTGKHACIRMRAHARTLTRARTHTHAHTRTRTHAHTHTHTHAR